MTRRERLAEADDFDEFYRVSYARLVGQLLAVTGDLQQAEDVVQEAFIRALARWSDIRRYQAPELWVRRVALNLAVSEFRRIRRQVAALLRLGDPTPSTPATVEVQPVLELLRQVPINQRPVLLLHYLLDLPVEEVAAQLALPVGTVRGRLARARARLRRHLDDDRGRSTVQS